MTSGRYLLDTSIIASLFRGDTGVQSRIAEAEEVFVGSITLGELFYGAFKSQRTEDELKKISGFAQAVRVLDCDSETAEVYGRIKTALRAKVAPSLKMTSGSLRRPCNTSSPWLCGIHTSSKSKD